ncbi:S9 family peptidase [Granulosicoccus sp. 3-233]|uniref:S9 family peptidase n=1 Tax=Granulosicoccus sp. 3-233 TaxID=3417969 RepID=UPI003D32A32E
MARPVPVEHELHGVRWTDDFHWLRAQDWQACVNDPELLPEEIRQYLLSENAWCETRMAETTQLQATLQAEMRGRIQADDDSLPDAEGPWSYFERYQGDDEHASYWRQKRLADEQPHLLLDFNVEARGHAYYSPGEVEYSPDHAWLAWTVDTSGAERHVARVRDLNNGEDRDTIADVDSLCWGDAQHLFYTRMDEDLRANRVYRHVLGSDSSDDALVYEEPDPRFACSVWTSLSGDYVFISSDTDDQSEVWYVPCTDITASPVLIEARSASLEYSVEHQADRFLILTNADGASDFKVMQAPCATPSRQYWREWLPARDGCMVLDVYAYRDWIMWIEREDALPRICYTRSPGASASGEDVTQLDSSACRIASIAFEEEAYSMSLEPLLEFDEQRFRFGYESPSTPEQTWLFDMASGERCLLKEQKIPGGHDASAYVVRRLNAPSLDGELIPVTVLYHRDTRIDGSAPCWLSGYGAYGSSIPASFAGNMLSLVDRGFVHATAHVRGGQEKGRAWYEAARFGGKQHSIDDLICVGRYLVSQHYTAVGKIVLSGASAGGLLVGAALNQESELWGAAVADVPFVDVLHTLLDDTLPLTPGEWSQWGNPLLDENAFEDIRRYCPYLNVQARAYPPMLVTAGISDSRVTYWEPAKWVARHRQLRSDSTELMLKTQMQGGHFGEAGRYASLADTALEQAFALKVMGLLPD